MAFPSLREFIAKIDSMGELVRISQRVSPILEISEITDRVSKLEGGGKALLFENVEGSAMPVLINTFGSWKRMCAALDVEKLDDIATDMERFLKIAPPQSLFDKARLIPLLLQASNFPPRMVSTAPCQEIVHTGDAVDLSRIPVLQCWPNDAGRFITYPIVINRSTDRKIRNVGLYRMQVYDRNTTAMHWHIHKDGAHFFHEFKRKNKRMEVAVAIGADPATCYSASAPLPYGVDEFLLAGFLRKKAVPLVKCKTVNLEVPANAEIVLEGYIDPQELRLEGPFGDHTGYYSQDGDYPVFHVTAVTYRKNPIYMTTIVGIPPQEDYYLGKATERIFLPLLKMQWPEVVDMNMPLEGVFHNCVIVSIDKRYPMQARRLMSALWGAGQMSFVKIIIVVDSSQCSVHDEGEILKLILNRTDLDRDLFFSEGILDVLNHASDKALYGSKLGIDLTDPVDGESERNELEQATINDSGNLERHILKSFPKLEGCRLVHADTRRSVLLASMNKTQPHQTSDFIKAFLANEEFADITVLCVFEKHVDLRNNSTMLWKLFNNLDPKRDYYRDGKRIGIDLSQKLAEEGYEQDWPEEIIMSEDIKKKVDENWNRIYPQ
ncbi:MAG: menaquinone biosynthesis decarboxylase [Candidatus Nitronauta litoralis]|uniref:Menaquinone biosynthesis decarboxylase n=1 Tax=Candidatus Nitronauta litoralis TaxID=2705533 RepID=A0A7T0BY51_9BACT|nr:MAG: menaquinone biosynthesis decarboxylase [Candidatus Nitronauta litoralis]